MSHDRKGCFEEFRRPSVDLRDKTLAGQDRGVTAQRVVQRRRMQRPLVGLTR